jgi:hypothetical protein
MMRIPKLSELYGFKIEVGHFSSDIFEEKRPWIGRIICYFKGKKIVALIPIPNHMIREMPFLIEGYLIEQIRNRFIFHEVLGEKRNKIIKKFAIPKSIVVRK